jgi:hypothetical protein
MAGEVSVLFLCWGCLGGFGEIANLDRFGEDERLTEAYAKDIWAEGYQG